MSTNPAFPLILVFGPATNISANWGHSDLCRALLAAFNSDKSLGSDVPSSKFKPHFITLPLGDRRVNALAFHV
jgi:hypothetical protein